MTEDAYWPEPRETYAQRRQRYLEFCAAQSPGGRTGFFSQIARLELGLAVDEAPIREGIAFVDSRRDCCDFAVGGLLRIVYKYHDSPAISPDLVRDQSWQRRDNGVASAVLQSEMWRVPPTIRSAETGYRSLSRQ